MGITDFICSSADAVKRNAPDLTPVKSACRSTYGYGCSAASWVDRTVRDNGVHLFNRYLSGDEGRAKAGEFATNLVKNTSIVAAREGFKLVPGGGLVFNVVQQSIPCGKKSNKQMETELISKKHEEMISAFETRSQEQERKIEALEARLAGIAEEINVPKSLQKRHAEIEPRYEPQLCSNAIQTPDDAVNLLMMEFVLGKRQSFRSDLILPVGAKIFPGSFKEKLKPEMSWESEQKK